MGSLTDVAGIRVGHSTDREAWTGCTVVLCEEGAVGGVEVRGGAAGTHGLDTLRVFNLVEAVHGVVLTGGSAFGLAAVFGVMQYLEERGIGFETRVAKVPIVAGAVIFDLALGRADRRPDAAMGYEACLQAHGGPLEEGNVGAGTGASVGKLYGMEWAMKSGLGTASRRLVNGAVVGALAVVNAYGDVYHPATGRILAGARHPRTGQFVNMVEAMKAGARRERFGEPAQPPPGGLESTTLVVVATDARLNKVQANKLAQLAHNGLARTIAPVHTFFDGDTVFALATGRQEADFHALGVAAVEAVEEAIVRAVLTSESAAGLPSARSLHAGGLTP